MGSRSGDQEARLLESKAHIYVCLLPACSQDKRKENWSSQEWEHLFPKDIPRQHNGCDCGVFASMFANRLGLNQPFDFQQADVRLNIRVTMVNELMDGKLKE